MTGAQEVQLLPVPSVTPSGNACHLRLPKVGDRGFMFPLRRVTCLNSPDWTISPIAGDSDWTVSW